MILNRRFSRRYRYILCATLITIVLLNYIKQGEYLHEYFTYKKCENLVFNEFSDEAKKYIYFGNKERVNEFNVTELRRWIRKQNARKKVLNEDLYGPLTTKTIIFVVQVRQYSCNINYLLASLSEVDGIQDSIIIFSHSYVDHNLNRLIKTIDFCRVLQIFYPLSIQAYPDEFPGYARNDCQPNLKSEVSKNLTCISRITPDQHGRYRDPISAEKKHHWWWTANQVFEDLSYTAGYKGLVIFLEPNFYIYKNFIYFVYRMKSIADSLPQCDFLSLGSAVDVKDENPNGLVFTTWNSKYHSDILAMDLSTWYSVKSHSDIFCGNGYSWSRSLFDVSLSRRDGKMFKVLSTVSARALQTTFSSVDLMDYHVLEKIIQINLQIITKDNMFPAYFKVFHEIELDDEEFINIEYAEISGGWNDQRDKELCYDMTLTNIKKYFVTRNRKHYLETYD